MKKFTTILFSIILCIGAMAQNPAITITTAITVGNQISFKIGAEVASTTIQVDFGNGTKTNFTAGIISSPATISGAIVGSQTIKIYGTGINYFYCQDNQLTNIDVTSCPTLIFLYLSRNKLTELNVKYNTALQTLQFGSNNISNIDLISNVLLNNLDCASNKLTSLDLSQNSLLNSVWCNSNYLTLTTVPRLNIGYYIYKPQAPFIIPDNITVGSILDLSSQSVVDGINTVYEWKTEYNTPLVENKDYTISNGKTTFLKEQSVSVYCVMSNASFPTSAYFGISTTKTRILKQNQIITFNALPAKNANDAPFSISATASSGLTISFTSSDPTIASINGTTVTLLKAGTVTIAASQAGNDSWTSATASQTLTINKVAQTITFSTLPGKKANDAAFNLSATASSGLTVTFTSSDPSIASVSGNTVTIKKAGSVTITAAQAGDGKWATASSVAQTLTISPVTGIGEEKEDIFSVYPNPTADMLYFKGKGLGNLSISIFNLTGAKVWSGVVKEQRADISQLPAGVYILKTSSKKETQTIRFVKQ